MQDPADQKDHDDRQDHHRGQEQYERAFVDVDPKLAHDDRHQRIDIGPDEHRQRVLCGPVLNDQTMRAGGELRGRRAVDRDHDGDGEDRDRKHRIRDDLQQPVRRFAG